MTWPAKRAALSASAGRFRSTAVLARSTIRPIASAASASVAEIGVWTAFHNASMATIRSFLPAGVRPELSGPMSPDSPFIASARSPSSSSTVPVGTVVGAGRVTSDVVAIDSSNVVAPHDVLIDAIAAITRPPHVRRRRMDEDVIGMMVSAW